MSQFIGYHESRLDAKGRVMLPAALRKQLNPEAKDSFVINRGFEQQLSLYPMDEWEKLTSQLKQLNLFVAKNRKFYRLFHNGATPLSLDGTGRLLLPKPLMNYADIKRDVILYPYANRIEVWAPEVHKRYMEDESDGFADLAEEVMGNLPDHNDPDNVS